MPKPSGANQDNASPSSPSPVHSRPHVRAAVLDDAERLAEINRLTWQDAYAGIVPDTYLETLEPEKLRARWVARIEDPADRVSLVAEVDGQVASYAVAGPYRVQQDAEPEDTDGWGELYALYTDPDLQGRGAGLAVHDAALEALSGQGHEVVALWVLRDNTRTRRWYGERGWRPDGASSEWLGAGVPLDEIRLTRSTSGAGANGRLGDRSSRLGR
jgi:GNAT superfamily N-acetyltransferase